MFYIAAETRCSILGQKVIDQGHPNWWTDRISRYNAMQWYFNSKWQTQKSKIEMIQWKRNVKRRIIKEWAQLIVIITVKNLNRQLMNDTQLFMQLIFISWKLKIMSSISERTLERSSAWAIAGEKGNEMSIAFSPRDAFS